MTPVDRPNASATGPSRALVLAAFAAIYVIWGSTYLAIKFAVETVPPFLMTGARFFVAGTVLYAWSVFRSPNGSSDTGATPRVSTGRQWRDAFLVGAALIVGGTALVSWAELSVPSGITSLILASNPLWMVLLESAFESRQVPSARVLVGVCVGLAGLAILIGPSLTSPSGDVSLLGVAALLVSALTWSVGAMYARRAAVPASPVRATSMQMIAGALLSVVAAFAFGEHRGFSVAAISPSSWIAIGYLVIAGALVGFTAYLWLMRVSTPSRVATHAYVNPVVAVLLGWGILGEPITVRTGIAMSVIVLAVVLIVSAPRRVRSRDPRGMLSFPHGKLAERRS
jgi:drug/metabolite transporter (DMT)-like permease